MRTQYFKVHPEHPDTAILAAAAVILQQGGLVAFPTETVYGLGANGLDEQAVAGIYRAKGRPSDNPLILHIADAEMAEMLAAEIPANAKVLMEAYWPGPLTIVLKRRKIVPDIVTGGLNTVAIRLPDSVVARTLIRMTGRPLAGPSANTSGRPSPTSAQMVLADLADRIDAVLDAGVCTIGVESTVIDCTTPVPTLLRPGGVTLEMLLETLGEVEVDPALENTAEFIPRAPGMKYTHYAPKAPLVLIQGQPAGVAKVLQEKVREAVAAGKKVGIVASDEMAAEVPSVVAAAAYGARGDVSQAAANLYSALRFFDDVSVDIIFAEGLPEQGLGLAVMNRLRKAAGQQLINV